MARILIIDDEECIRYTFDGLLTAKGHQVSSVSDYDEAIASISQAEFDLVFADVMLQGKTGIDFLRECRQRGMTCPVVMITAYPDIQSTSEAIRLGAFDYLAKPVEAEALWRVTDLALECKRLANEKEQYRLHLDAVFRSVHDLIVTVDDNLVVTGTNEPARHPCEISGEAIGKDIRSLKLGCMRSCLKPLEETIEKRRALKAYRLECGKTGASHVVNVSTYPLIYPTGVVKGAVMVLKDETRLVQLEQDLVGRQSLRNIIGASTPMQKLYSLVKALADVDSTVMLTGESGTGKELFAEALHHLGTRRDKPFVKVNCGSLSESLIESELFGHVKGAFTGAVTDKVGRFQKADGGTIFLDEIEDLSDRMQSSLLRVLQDREFERVGDSTPKKVNIRIITATNRDLRERVKLGEFREDLLYRMAVVELRLPPLRERRGDIELLVEHFLKEFNEKLEKRISAISADVARLFMEYRWPGNVRELRHALEHACILCQQDTITMDHLPTHLVEDSHVPVSAGSSNGKHTLERDELLRALEKTGGNKARAARLLRIDRKTLYRKLAKYRIAESASDPTMSEFPGIPPQD